MENLVSFDEIMQQENDANAMLANKRIEAIMSKVASKAEFCEHKMDCAQLEVIENCLKAIDTEGGVAVLARRFFDEEHMKLAVPIDCGDFVCRFIVCNSQYDWGYKQVLMLTFEDKKEPNGEDELLAKRKERFSTWITRKAIPCGDEICVIVDMHSDVQFHIFGKAAEFVKAIKPLMNEVGSFIGQEPDDKWRFVPNSPIGFVYGNEVYLSVPGWRWEKTDWTFFVEPKKD